VRARTVVVDANVLFSIELTDLFLTFAKRRLLQIRWSEEILSEVRRSLATSGRLSPAAIDRRLAAMQRALPDATAEVPRTLIEQLRVKANDRHVLALAVAVGADAIITFNVRDFPADYCMSLDIEVLTPDDVAVETLRANSVGVMAALREIAMRRKMPSMNVGNLLERWQVQLPGFAEMARDA
jgi:predicted nucleic acid-binding protein